MCDEYQVAADERPALCRELDSTVFRSFYYLKQELVDFCRENALPVSGGKPELTERIAFFLDTGEVLPPSAKKRPAANAGTITEDTIIATNVVYSENLRAFFRERIGKSFSFNVPFQKWLKDNAGKTYRDAISAYHQFSKERKQDKTTIGRQFEYNTYIRDFFADNHGLNLADAVVCWKCKKSLPGHHRYERSDLMALNQQIPQNEKQKEGG